jgi:hypothetical protein
LSIDVEEADAAVPNMDRNKMLSSTYNLCKCVRKGRKHSFNMRFVTQKFGSLHEDVYGFAKMIILGPNLAPSDLKKLGEMCPSRIVNAAKRLEYNPRLNTANREFIVIYEDRKSFDVFKPFMCPVNYYREEEFDLDQYVHLTDADDEEEV